MATPAPDSAPRPTAAQAELLRAIDAGDVADRRHLAAGWATRRTDRRSGGRGGGLGANVTAAAKRLRDAGWAEPGDPVECGPRAGDRPWRLTVSGRMALANHAAREQRRGTRP